MNIAEKFQEELDKGSEIPCFEIKVSEAEWHVWDVFINQNWVSANDYLNTLSVRIDPCFSLTEHLEKLYNKCLNFSLKESN